MIFPSISPPVYPIKEIIPDTSFKGKLENLTIITRRRFTRTPIAFELTWTALPESEYVLLREFYAMVNGAIAFGWTYPVGAGGTNSGKTFRVRFDGDFIFSSTKPGLWEGTVKLVEI